MSQFCFSQFQSWALAVILAFYMMIFLPYEFWLGTGLAQILISCIIIWPGSNFLSLPKNCKPQMQSSAQLGLYNF